HSRTAAAAREFVGAVASDVVALGRLLARLAVRLGRSMAGAGRRTARKTSATIASAMIAARARSAPSPRLAPSPRRPASRPRTWGGASGHVLRRFGLAIVAIGIIGTIAASGAMLWALQDLPLERQVGEPDRPSLLLEAANGEPLGRIGPLRVADA